MLVWIIVLAWVVSGAVALAVMRRRGHDPFAWGLLFVVPGPLALPLAVSADRHRPPEPEGRSREGEPGHILQHYAAEHGYELIVTGCGRPRSTHLVRGRAARSVATASPVPVFVGPSAR